jgi:hypothetical protein
LCCCCCCHDLEASITRYRTSFFDAYLAHEHIAVFFLPFQIHSNPFAWLYLTHVGDEAERFVIFTAEATSDRTVVLDFIHLAQSYTAVFFIANIGTATKFTTRPCLGRKGMVVLANLGW